MHDKFQRLSDKEYISSEKLAKALQCSNACDADHTDQKTIDAHYAWADYGYIRMDVYIQKGRISSYEANEVLAEECGLQADSELRSAEALEKSLKLPQQKNAVGAEGHRAMASRNGHVGLINKMADALKLASVDDKSHQDNSHKDSSHKGNSHKDEDNSRKDNSRQDNSRKDSSHKGNSHKDDSHGDHQQQWQQQTQHERLSEVDVLNQKLAAAHEVISDLRNDKLVLEDSKEKLEGELKEAYHYMSASRKKLLKEKDQKYFDDAHSELYRRKFTGPAWENFHEDVERDNEETRKEAEIAAYNALPFAR